MEPVDFVQYRIKLWDEFKQKLEQEKTEQPEKPIKVTLPDGKVIDGIAGKTTPLEIAGNISKRLRDETVVAKVDDKLFDAWRPLESDCTLALLNANTPEGRKVLSHSSAHVLGQAMEAQYNCNLCVGPAIDGVDHFFYEARLPEGQTVSSEDFLPLKKKVEQYVSAKQPFERLEVPKELGIKFMEYNPYKKEILQSKVPEGGTCTLYRCGNLIDPCSGPHVVNTSFVNAFAVTKVSSSYWKADATNDVLQRLYGVSFRSAKELKEYQERIRKAEEHDHRKVGTAQELFFFHPLSPGSCFFLPHGTRVYNKLMDFFRSEYWKRGFSEVVTPNIYNSNLWETSGHWQNYKENMFSFEVEKQTFALKPMNCPGHCLMFDHRSRSYKELPIRLADFGVLHRNEASGALTGLTRVRRFQQDDAHIFCAPEQIKSEMKGAIDFLQFTYGVFGFHFDLELSTRPEKYLGEVEDWNAAEQQLKEVLDEYGKPWKLNPGDGAFYGPKIDIHVKDALGRTHQCATIQLDFQLPIKFKLSYVKDDGSYGTPVIIHRAICGSVERMMAILIEHTEGKWPFWLSPRQCLVIPVAEAFNDYAKQVRDQIHDAGYYSDVELSDKQLNKKIREGQLAQYNFILVVGQAEAEKQTVNVRTRDNVVHGERTVVQLLGEFNELVENKKYEPPSAGNAAAAAKKGTQPKKAANPPAAKKGANQPKKGANQGQNKGGNKSAAPAKAEDKKEAAPAAPVEEKKDAAAAPAEASSNQ